MWNWKFWMKHQDAIICQREGTDQVHIFKGKHKLKINNQHQTAAKAFNAHLHQSTEGPTASTGKASLALEGEEEGAPGPD